MLKNAIQDVANLKSAYISHLQAFFQDVGDEELKMFKKLDLFLLVSYSKYELENSHSIAPVDGVKHQHFILSQIHH